MSLSSHGATAVLNSRLRAHGPARRTELRIPGDYVGVARLDSFERAQRDVHQAVELAVGHQRGPGLLWPSPGPDQLLRLGQIKPVLAPHQLSSRRYENSVWLMLASLYAPVPTGQPLAGS